MNRYPAWKYALIVVVFLIAALYTLPNFFGEAPAVQVSSSKAAVKVDTTTLAKVEQALKSAGIAADGITLEAGSIKARFGDTDTQLKAKDAVQKALSPEPSDSSYIVALNLSDEQKRDLKMNSSPKVAGASVPVPETDITTVTSANLQSALMTSQGDGILQQLAQGGHQPESQD